MNDRTAPKMCLARAKRPYSPTPTTTTPPMTVQLACYRADGHADHHFDLSMGEWIASASEAPPVSARDRLLRQLAMCPEATALVDAYAHELAEFLRSDADHRTAGYGHGLAYAPGMRHAADLIDPEAQR